MRFETAAIIVILFSSLGFAQSVGVLTDSSGEDCKLYFSTNYIDGGEEPHWGWISKNMYEWMEKAAKKELKNICFTSDPLKANFIIGWSESRDSVPYSYTVPRTETSQVHITTSNGVSGYGTVTTTHYDNYSGQWPLWHVTTFVSPVEPGKPVRTIFKSKHTGRWRWSKPDKDVLVESINYIRQKGIPKLG